MKRNLTFSILLGAGMILFLAGCQQKGPEGSGTGDLVQFKATSGPSTRTAYSGIVDDNKIERIDWSKGDQVLVWSDEAVDRLGNGKKNSMYEVGTITPNNEQSVATVTDPMGTGLVFTEGVDQFTFWGFYPYGETSTTPTVDIVSYVMPATQSGTEYNDTDKTIVKPDMTNAYMVAVESGVAPKTLVDLKFYPAFTAFEITVTGDAGNQSDLDLASVTLTSASGYPVAGNVTANIKSGLTSTYTVANKSESITYTLPSDAKVKKDQNLTFTIFAVPQAINGLTLTFTFSDNSTRTARIKTKDGNDVTFAACKKHRLYGLALPEGDWHLYLETDIEQWQKEALAIQYGTASDDGAVISASALEFVAGYSAKTDRVSVTLSSAASTLTAYYSVYSPTNGTWRITMVGENADDFILASAQATVDGHKSVSGNGSYLEGTVTDRIIFTVASKVTTTTTGEGEEAVTTTTYDAAGESVELYFTVFVNGKEYSLHTEVTRSALPLTVNVPA